MDIIKVSSKLIPKIPERYASFLEGILSHLPLVENVETTIKPIDVVEFEQENIAGELEIDSRNLDLAENDSTISDINEVGESLTTEPQIIDEVEIVEPTKEETRKSSPLTFIIISAIVMLCLAIVLQNSLLEETPSM